VAIALGNSADARAVPALTALLNDESELVRAMAVWGLSRHLPAGEFAKLRAARIGAESDADVRAEWGA
jgi:epoxyqueuosine reductase